MSNEIVRRDEAPMARLISAPVQMAFGDMVQASEILAQSGLWKMNANQILSLMLLSQAEGKHPAQAVREYDVVNDRPAKKSMAIQADFQAAGGKIEWLERTETAAEARFYHPSGGTLDVRWTFQMATAAGLTGKQTWKAYPRQMLSARVIAEGVRAVLPGVCLGIYSEEEVKDFDAPMPAPAAQVPAAQVPAGMSRAADVVAAATEIAEKVLPGAQPAPAAEATEATDEPAPADPEAEKKAAILAFTTLSRLVGCKDMDTARRIFNSFHYRPLGDKRPTTAEEWEMATMRLQEYIDACPEGIASVADILSDPFLEADEMPSADHENRAVALV